VWHENFFTAQGRNLHERVDKQGERIGQDVRVEYSVPLRSYSLGLVGRADVVEFHKKELKKGISTTAKIAISVGIINASPRRFAARYSPDIYAGNNGFTTIFVKGGRVYDI
jgi:hypothetical protein